MNCFERHAGARKERIERCMGNLSEHDKDFYLKLFEIHEDNSKIIKCDKLESNEYICFNGKDFTYEDGSFLGHTPEDVVRLFRYELTWAEDAVWSIATRS